MSTVAAWLIYYVVIVALFLTFVSWSIPKLVDWQVNCTPNVVAGHNRRFQLCL